MATTKRKHIDFIVTTSDPNDASSTADNKRRVRSVAALKSWPERRKKFFDQLEPTGACQSTFLIQRPVTPPVTLVTRPRKRKATSPAEPPIVSPGDDIETSTTPKSKSVDTNQKTNNGSFRPSPSPEGSQTEPLSEDVRHTILSLLEEQSQTSDGSVSPIDDEVALPTPPCSPRSKLDKGCSDPFNCYPVAHKPYHDHILHHMLNIYCPRGWPALQISTAEGLSWEHYMTLNALAEPALFYVRLYFGSGDLVRLGTIGAEIMHWLRIQSIRTINEALDDPERATSDALILAVGRIALSEFQYGDKEAACTVHRPAQARMIELRGGMRALGIPELLKRLMRWADRVMAMQTNTARVLEDDDHFVDFTLEQSIEVLEKWVPSEGKKLRQKIEIVELIADEDNT